MFIEKYLLIYEVRLCLAIEVAKIANEKETQIYFLQARVEPAQSRVS